MYARKDWDSEFFGREIYQLGETDKLDERTLRRALDDLDRQQAWGIEAQITAENFHRCPLLERFGFRLVDSKMTFISKMTRHEIGSELIPRGRLREVTSRDLPRISALTAAYIVDNPSVYSRFKNPDLFDREESIRYYDACNERAFAEDATLFSVWEVEGEVVAYFCYQCMPNTRFDPLYKGILTTVEPAYRGNDAHNRMQNFIFRKIPSKSWWIDNTTQVSNTAVIKNHIKANKSFFGASLIFFRTRDEYR